MNKRWIKRLIAVILPFPILILTVLPLMGKADSILTIGESRDEVACICEVKCSDTTLNTDCPVCLSDVTGCTGKEVEAPECVCDVKCTETTPNMNCPVCAFDVSACAGKEKAFCTCTDLCTEGKINPDCPICAKDFTACKGSPVLVPESKITIDFTTPSGWKTKEAEVLFTITDDSGAEFKKAQVKVEKNGNWQDVTDNLTREENRYFGSVKISENCTVYVNVIGKDEKVYEKSCYIECFDRTAPTIRARLDGKLLRAEADDDLSGVAAIYIDGEKFQNLTNGTLDVSVNDLDDGFPEFVVQSVDYAGNKSKIVSVKNPVYKEPETENSKIDKTDEKLECPQQTEKAKCPEEPKTPKTESSGCTVTSVIPDKTASTSSKTNNIKPSTSVNVAPKQKVDNKVREPVPFTPDGQGTVVDNATNEDGKEFFTITTANENIFYLVIDRQRDNENVYFLNAVTETDLMALAQADKEPESEAKEPVCTCTEKCEAGAVNTLCPVCKLNRKQCLGEVPEEPQPQKEHTSNAGLMLFVVLTLAIGGAAGWYFKIYRPKQDFIDEDDAEQEEGGEFGTETINEDEETSGVIEDTDGETEVEYYDDYPDDIDSVEKNQREE